MGKESGGSKAEGGKKREGRGRGSTDHGAGSVAAKGDGASSLYSVEAAVLGFDPAEFTDGAQQVLIGNVEGGLEDAKEDFLEAAGKEGVDAGSAAVQEALDKDLSSLRDRARRRVNANMDRFEIYAVRNIFGVPERLTRPAPPPPQTPSAPAPSAPSSSSSPAPPLHRYSKEEEDAANEELAALRLALRKYRRQRLVCAERIRQGKEQLQLLEPQSYALRLAEQELTSELSVGLDQTLEQIGRDQQELRALQKEAEGLMRELEVRGAAAAAVPNAKKRGRPTQGGADLEGPAGKVLRRAQGAAADKPSGSAGGGVPPRAIMGDMSDIRAPFQEVQLLRSKLRPR